MKTKSPISQQDGEAQIKWCVRDVLWIPVFYMMKEVLVSNPWSRSSSSGRQGMLRTLLITSYISLLCTDSCVSLSIPPCGVNKPHLPLRFHPGASSPNGKKQNSNSCPYKKQPAFETWPCWKPTELNTEEKAKGILKKEEKKKQEVINQHFVQPNLVSKTFIKTNIPVQANPGSPVSGHVDLTSWLSAVPLIYKMVSKKVTVCGNGKHMGWWLLSVKIAGMAHVARRNVKLSAGRQKLCEEREKKLFQKTRDRSLPGGGGGTGTWRQRTPQRQRRLHETPALPGLVVHTLVPQLRGGQRRFFLQSRGSARGTDFCRLCTGVRVLLPHRPDRGWSLKELDKEARPAIERKKLKLKL